MFQSDQAGSRLLFGGSETAGRLSRRGAADSSLAGTGSRKFAMLKRFFPDQHPHAGRDIGRLVDSRVLAPNRMSWLRGSAVLRTGAGPLVVSRAYFTRISR